MADVFISYARPSAQAANAAAELLRAAGYSVWMDDELPAYRAYTHVIEEQLNVAKVALVLWSTTATQSEWVLSEANRARETKKLVQANVETARLPMPFDQIECADLAGWSGDSDARGWRKVMASISALITGNAPVGDNVAAVLDSARSDEPLLAVLAFDNLSGDLEMGFFSDGVSEEIQHAVSQRTNLKVIGRASSFQFRGVDKAAGHVRSELGATHVLDGTVRRSGTRVRISAELVDCKTETTLWAERYDRDLTDIFEVQDEIAGALADALKAAFSPSASSNSIDPEAYEHYLQGRAQLDRQFGGVGMLQALPLYESAVSVAPNFARAWAQLAQARGYVLRGIPEDRPESVTRASVIEAASTALRLDSGCGVAYLALGNLEPWGNYKERKALIDKALDAAPNDPEILMAAANISARVGRTRDALAYGQRAQRLDPLFPVAGFYCATMLEMCGDYEGSCPLFDELIERWPDVEYMWKTAIYIAACNKDWPRMNHLLAESAQKNPDHESVKPLAAFGASLRGEMPGFSKEYLKRLRASYARSGWLDFRGLAWLYALGEKDATFDLIEDASFANIFDPDGQPPGGWANESIFFSTSSNMEMLQDVRFVGFCGRIGLCDFWVGSDTWPDFLDGGFVAYDFKAEALAHCLRDSGKA